MIESSPIHQGRIVNKPKIRHYIASLHFADFEDSNFSGQSFDNLIQCVQLKELSAFKCGFIQNRAMGGSV